MTTAGTVTVEVNGRDVNLSDLLTKLERDVERFEKQSTEAGRKAGAGAQQARSGFVALQSAVAANEAATARAAAAQGNFAQAAAGYSAAIQRLESTLANQNATTTQTLGIERQLITLRGQAAKAAEQEANATRSLGAQLGQIHEGLGSLVSGFTSLNTALGGLGLALGAKQLYDFGVDAVQSSLKLQQTENALKQVAGSTEVYNKILAAAKQQQLTFGGSLEQNLSELSSFAVLARTTGADLNELIRTSQRLASLNPEQGISGAKFGLAEGLSGQITSLQRRFNIPAKDLEKLRDASTSAAEKLAIVNQYLDKAGIAANGMADAVPEATKAINQLNASLDMLKTNLGGQLAQAFLPAVQGAAQFTGALNGTVPATQGFAGALSAAGTASQPFSGAIAQILNPLGTYNNMVLNAASGAITWAFGQQQGAQATAQAQGALDPYVASLTQQTSASFDASAAIQKYQGDLQTEAAQSLINQTNTETLALAKQQLQGAAQAAANAVLASGGNIEAEAARLAASSSLVDQLTAAFLRLHAAQSGANNPAGFTATAAAAAQGRVPVEDQSRVFNQLVAAKKAREAETMAVGSSADKHALLNHQLEQQARYLGKNSAEYIQTRTRLEQLDQQEEKSAKKGRKAGAAKLSDQQKLNNTLAADEQRYQDQTEEAAIKHGQNLQKIEQDYQDKITDIQAKALEKRKQQADKNEIDKRSSELGFLESATSSSLNGSKNGQGDLARIQQQYYDAFDKAQQAAQNGELEKSQRLLDNAESRSQIELKYAEKIADLRDKADKEHDKKAKQSLQDQIGVQETLRQKALQIQDVKDQQTAASADAINAGEQQDMQKALADEQKALTDETQRNTQSLDKLTRALDNKADLAVGNAVRGGKAVSPAGTVDPTLNSASATANSTPTPANPVPVAPVASPSSAPITTSAPDLLSAVNALQGKLDEVKGAIESGASTVASKIQNQKFEVTTRSVG